MNTERVEPLERAENTEPTAETDESAENEEPRYRMGYPRIVAPDHDLFEAQQAGWPDHLPHEAWQAMARAFERRRKAAIDSADHPAFQPGYTPNYAATQESPAEAPPESTAKARR